MSDRKLYNYSFSVKPHISRIREHKEYSGWIEGYVWTEYGAVGVYSQGSDNNLHASNLDFLYNGRIYTRKFKKKLSKRQLIIEAKKFAKEITEHFKN